MDEPIVAPGERRARRMALLSLVALAAAAVALYAWIQIGSPEPTSAPTDTSFSAFGRADAPAIGAGDAAPDFVAELLDGGEFSLSGHFGTDGRPVFLNLWASWCLPCREEMPAIDAAAARHPNVYFIGVAVQDQRAAAEAFARQIGVGYDLAFDSESTVESGYPILGMPATFLISPEGVILSRVYGQLDQGDIDAQLATYLGG